ncbi:MAG: nitroreductase family protein [Deltaproteobacteria bacterium]|jgi:nitroreductase|nr:nitroreductase family protein [Deltaproteobacteria bacterium]
MITNLIKKNRSCRRFYQDQAVSLATLKELVNLGRFSASGANLQPLKYILSCDPSKNSQIFACLAWAGYLKDWPGPADGERPAAYVVILADKTISQDAGCDHGIAAQSILLGAREKKLGGCMLGSINRKALRNILAIPEHLKILLVLAIGKPREQVVLETVDAGGSIRYWRDKDGVHHVPKRKLDDIIIAEH